MLRWIGMGVVALAAALGAGSKYAKRALPVFPVDLAGKTIIVTGASAGVGKESARILAEWGAEVIMAVRSPEKGEAVAADIKATTGRTDGIEVWKMDLADLSSVQAFAQRYLASGKRLDVLMNNAGLVSWEHIITKDGHELSYQTNHLGHHLLTKLLMPRLQASAPARVVQVSSEAHQMGDLNVEDLDWDVSNKKYNAMKQYSNTKLMNVVYANELTRRYKDTGVVAMSLHPGFVATDFLRDLPKFLDPVKKVVLDLFARDEVQGSLTQVWAATHPELEGVGGIYLDACKEAAMNKKATNETLAALFWEKSEEQIAAFVLPEAAEGVAA